MNLVQKYFIFVFHDGQFWKQILGAAMDIHPSPSFANIYLVRRLDEVIEHLGFKYGRNNKSVFKIRKQFFDDLFQIYKGTPKQLH